MHRYDSSGVGTTFTLGAQKGVWSIVFMTGVKSHKIFYYSKCRVRVMLCLIFIEQMNTDDKSRLSWGCMLLSGGAVAPPVPTPLDSN